MRIKYKRASAGLAAALTGAAVATVVATNAGATPGPTVHLGAGEHYAAQVTRTEYGIPHVLAPTLGSAGYGYGYTFTQDNLCSLADAVLTLRGERSKFLGPDGTVDNGGGPATNVDSDTYFRSLNDAHVVERLLTGRNAPSKQARELVAGYAAGVNRYLRDTGADRLPDPTCRGKAWVRPITELDVWRMMHHLNQLGGLSGFTTSIATAAPGKQNGTAPAPAVHNDIGSNAWGLGSDVTKDHSGMVLGNPHFPWSGMFRFYQVQLTVPGLLDVAGGSVFGTPTVEVGHNHDLAWTHTVSSAQRFTLFQLKLQPGHPTTYLVDGKAEPMKQKVVRVPVRGKDGTVTEVRRTLYDSRYGPVIADSWGADSAFAVRGSNVDNLRDVDEWLGLGRARTIGELNAVQRKHQSMPFVDTIAADKSGTTYYGDVSVVPNVTDAQAARCVDTPEGHAMYPRTIVLDGAHGNCAWGTDKDAVQPGTFGPSTAPQLTRHDYVSNSNESAWLTNADAPLTGFPRIYGDIADTRSPRDRLSHQMIADRRAGTDGLGAPGFDLPSLQGAMLGDRELTAEMAKSDVVAMCRANPSLTATDGTTVDVRQACDVLAKWDGKADTTSRGTVLWREFWLRAIATKPGVHYLVPFDPEHPVTTPNKVDTSTPGLRASLADAVQVITAHGLALDVAFGDTQFTDGRIPVAGCTGAEGCFNITNAADRTLRDDGTYGPIEFGSSFIMAAQLTPDGPRVRTILTYSLSANPASPHHTDQTVLYQHKQWVTERFTQDEIAAGGSASTIRE
ncbi:penicillin acylase family protein [Labedaea rhizosphaerae]|uniref:Acyl-homoserine-lactone acylase n=1 Tax=Labedaea rhizosphaerae TaxID=598644 RepID=A0A4R6S574_LABRH|nr:penicillin acylase family protein [Labedaea rhizosphaerae]TDP94892.1 acyl-homoserine-lactone acylase [Labedaea rhizosphaerae]